MNAICLTGCTPTPFAIYLKAVAVLRILAEQKESQARGFWKDNSFNLLTDMDREQLLDFFCKDYQPTPIVSPWNGGSGFHPREKGQKGKNKDAIARILACQDIRFLQYQEVIRSVLSLPGIQFTAAFREQVKKNKQMKYKLMSVCRSHLPESALPWLDAAFVLLDDAPSYTPALGTGGNDGNFDMSHNFQLQIMTLLLDKPVEDTRRLLEASLFGVPCPGLMEASIGQLYPGRAGGYNQGTGFQQKDFKINPWDYVLMTEGTVVLAGGAVRRYPTPDRTGFTSPFTVRYSPVGFSSDSGEAEGRYESWLPLWGNPASWQEIRHLFGEGRNTIGRRLAGSGLEFSRAVGVLGTDRGIQAFERHVFLKRRGKSYLALSAGRLPVHYQPTLEIIKELDPLLQKMKMFLGHFKTPPAAFTAAFRGIQEQIFRCAQNANTDHFVELLRALGRFEALLAKRDRAAAPSMERPLYGLSPKWIAVADDNTTELRIAAVLASICPTGTVGDMRSFMAGTISGRPDRWDEKGRMHWQGGNLADRLGYVMTRRIMEADRQHEARFPLDSYLSLNPHDVIPFLNDECDDGKIEDLLWAFLLVDWRKEDILLPIRKAWKLSITREPLSRPWCLLKLLHHPGHIRDQVIRREPRITRLLQAGRTRETTEIARQRLGVSGLKPFPIAYDDRVLHPQRLLASLLFPVRQIHILASTVLTEQSIIQ